MLALSEVSTSDGLSLGHRSGLSIGKRVLVGDRWTQFVSEGSAFCIADQTESVVPPGSNSVVVFEVDDLDAAMKRAAEAGASVAGSIRDMGDHGRVAQVRDVENNVIQFLEKRPRPPSDKSS